MALIDLIDVSKRFNENVVLDNVNFSLAPKEHPKQFVARPESIEYGVGGAGAVNDGLHIVVGGRRRGKDFVVMCAHTLATLGQFGTQRISVRLYSLEGIGIGHIKPSIR